MFWQRLEPVTFQMHFRTVRPCIISLGNFLTNFGNFYSFFDYADLPACLTDKHILILVPPLSHKFSGLEFYQITMPLAATTTTKLPTLQVPRLRFKQALKAENRNCSLGYCIHNPCTNIKRQQFNLGFSTSITALQYQTCTWKY